MISRRLNELAALSVYQDNESEAAICMSFSASRARHSARRRRIANQPPRESSSG
jgi:hypothetical protein